MSSKRALVGAVGTAVGAVLLALPWNTADARVVAMEVSITIDQVGPSQNGMKPGQVHKACVFFDDSKIDPKTKRVALLHETHAGGVPHHLDPQQMPMANGWLDFSGTPIRYHYAAAPTTVTPEPYFVLFNEKTLRMSIYRQDNGELILGGNYTVNPQRITGPAVDAVVATSDPVVPPWESGSEGPRPGAGGPGAAGPGAPKEPGGANAARGPEPSACPAGNAS